MTVTAKEDEQLESLLRRFKKKVDDEGIIKEFRERQYFIKPSAKRHIIKKKAIRKNKVDQKERMSKLMARR